MSSIQRLHVLGAEEIAVNRTDKTYFLSRRGRTHAQQTVLNRVTRDEGRKVVKELDVGHPGVAS